MFGESFEWRRHWIGQICVLMANQECLSCRRSVSRRRKVSMLAARSNHFKAAIDHEKNIFLSFVSYSHKHIRSNCCSGSSCHVHQLFVRKKLDGMINKTALQSAHRNRSGNIHCSFCCRTSSQRFQTITDRSKKQTKQQQTTLNLGMSGKLNSNQVVFMCDRTRHNSCVSAQTGSSTEASE